MPLAPDQVGLGQEWLSVGERAIGSPGPFASGLLEGVRNNGFDKTRASRSLAERRADLIAFGKPFIANPDLVIRLFLDAPLAAFNRETSQKRSPAKHNQAYQLVETTGNITRAKS